MARRVKAWTIRILCSLGWFVKWAPGGDQNVCRSREDDDEGAGRECPLSLGANQDDVWEGGARVTQPVLDSFTRNSLV